jgi:DNA-binding NarL/FixJ family response regulator
MSGAAGPASISSGAEMTPITIVLADPHPGQCRKVRALLNAHPDLHVLAATGHRDAASELVALLDPDVIVIDVSLLGCGEFPLHGWPPISRATQLVGIGPTDDDRLAADLRGAGFAAYVPMTRLAADLTAAVVKASAGAPA